MTSWTHAKKLWITKYCTHRVTFHRLVIYLSRRVFRLVQKEDHTYFFDQLQVGYPNHQLCNGKSTQLYSYFLFQLWVLNEGSSFRTSFGLFPEIKTIVAARSSWLDNFLIDVFLKYITTRIIWSSKCIVIEGCSILEMRKHIIIHNHWIFIIDDNSMSSIKWL